jgi:hypothetical protein
MDNLRWPQAMIRLAQFPLCPLRRIASDAAEDMPNASCGRRKPPRSQTPSRRWEGAKKSRDLHDHGSASRINPTDYLRAGDGTRTHDVQLGKEAERQGLTSPTANFRLGT